MCAEAAASETMAGINFRGWIVVYHGLGGFLVLLVCRGCRLGQRILEGMVGLYVGAAAPGMV